MRHIMFMDEYLQKVNEELIIESTKDKNILGEFLAKRTIRAGKDTTTGRNDWLSKRHIEMGDRKNQSKNSQDINVYVDVSGNVNKEFLEIIAESLVGYMKRYEYSGINICPWASTNNGVNKIETSKKKDENEIVQEILSVISTGIRQCGEGTGEVSAIIDGIIEASLDDERKKIKKDDVHIVITDGYFDYQGIEAEMKASIQRAFNRGDVSDIVPHNILWMLYDTDERDRKEWEEEIKKGTLLFINSREVVKDNKKL